MARFMDVSDARGRALEATAGCYVGMSGFASPSARSALPSVRGASAAELLSVYAERFNAVEMDSSFYRPPGPQTVGAWRDVTEDQLTFVVRMTRDATHVQRLEDADTVVRFCDSLRPLEDRLGCVLFSTPPTLTCDAERVREILDAVPSGLRTAWEFRHVSWICPDVMDLLVAHGAGPVLTDTLDGVSGAELLPGGPLSEKWDVPFCYVRFRRDRYLVDDVLSWGELLRAQMRAGRDVYAFFKQSPEAPAYATALAEILAA